MTEQMTFGDALGRSDPGSFYGDPSSADNVCIMWRALEMWEHRFPSCNRSRIIA